MRIILLAGIILFFFSCSDLKHRALPSGLAQDSIIPREQMVKLLTDVHLLEAILQHERNQKKDIGRQTIAGYNNLFSRYGVSGKRFRLNLLYYQSDRQEFLKMYDEVFRDLEARQKKLKKNP